MKMDRLIGILSILLQRERVTAPELAEQFEVSRRTIQRDTMTVLTRLTCLALQAQPKKRRK